MNPGVCPAWEYEGHPQRTIKLGSHLDQLHIKIASGQMDMLATAKNTRQIHEFLFTGLTPAGYDYYAGHYRGEDYECLRYCEVGVGSDPRVGAPSEYVLRRMAHLAGNIETMLLAMDTAYAIPDVTIPRVQKLRQTVTVACRFFVDFLTIHPYMNGNGHAARTLLTVILKKYGYELRQFPIDPRPGPPYMESIKLYRDGDHSLLEAFVLSCIKK